MSGAPHEPVLPEQTRDDTDEGWGDDPERADGARPRDDEWYRSERPPHWG